MRRLTGLVAREARPWRGVVARTMAATATPRSLLALRAQPFARSASTSAARSPLQTREHGSGAARVLAGKALAARWGADGAPPTLSRTPPATLVIRTLSTGNAFRPRRTATREGDEEESEEQARRRLAPLGATSESEEEARRGGGGGGSGNGTRGGGGGLLRGLGVGSGLLLLFGKAKFVLVALKLTKFTSMASMLASMGVYSLIFGWPYAVGFVSLIAVHESGHAAVMRYYGIPFSPMVFVPFVGAAVQMERSAADAYEEAVVALGGPVLGGAAAIATGFAGVALDSQLLVALADAGIVLNMFNLLPIGMLDGGRIAGALSPWTLVAGLGGGVALAAAGVVHNPLFYVILVMGAFTTYERFTGDPPHPSYYRIGAGRKTLIGGSYVGLILMLMMAQAANAKHRKSPAQLRAERERQGLLSRGPSDAEASLQRFATDMAEGDPWFHDQHQRQQRGLEAEDPWFRQQQQQHRGSGEGGGSGGSWPGRGESV